MNRMRAVVIGTAVCTFLALPGALAAVPFDQFLGYWWVFPAAVCFSAVALASGVSGALFFSPFFVLVVDLQPAEAIGASLMTD